MKGSSANSKRAQWTKAHDRFLVSLLNGEETNWTDVANRINDKFPNFERTGKQCRERWHNYLDPSVTTQKITPWEEIKIFDLYK